jgi:hypothetical protein
MVGQAVEQRVRHMEIGELQQRVTVELRCQPPNADLMSFNGGTRSVWWTPSDGDTVRRAPVSLLEPAFIRIGLLARVSAPRSHSLQLGVRSDHSARADAVAQTAPFKGVNIAGRMTPHKLCRRRSRATRPGLPAPTAGRAMTRKRHRQRIHSMPRLAPSTVPETLWRCWIPTRGTAAGRNLTRRWAPPLRR